MLDQKGLVKRSCGLARFKSHHVKSTSKQYAVFGPILLPASQESHDKALKIDKHQNEVIAIHQFGHEISLGNESVSGNEILIVIKTALAFYLS